MNLAVRAAILSLLIAAPVQAQESSAPPQDGNQEQVQVSTNLICDTQQQVERFVELFDGNAEMAISTVNTEANTPNACVVATAAFVRGEERATASNHEATFQVVQIFVVGVWTVGGFEVVQPAEFFTLTPVEEPSGTVGRRV